MPGLTWRVGGRMKILDFALLKKFRVWRHRFLYLFNILRFRWVWILAPTFCRRNVFRLQFYKSEIILAPTVTVLRNDLSPGLSTP